MAAKLKRLDKKVIELSQAGDTVSLVGVSAGASAVLNYYSEHPNIHKVVLIAGKVQNPDNIHPRRFELNPDFKESIKGVGEALIKLEKQDKLSNILSISSRQDTVVSARDSYIKGANHKTINGGNHGRAIATSILFQGRTIAKFIKA